MKQDWFWNVEGDEFVPFGDEPALIMDVVQDPWLSFLASLAEDEPILVTAHIGNGSGADALAAKRERIHRRDSGVWTPHRGDDCGRLVKLPDCERVRATECSPWRYDRKGKARK